MTRFLSVLFAAMIALSLGVQADAAQRSRAKPEEPPPPPPQFKVDVATRPIAIERLGNAVPVGSVIGQFSSSCISFIGTPNPIYADQAFRNVPSSDFFNQFIAEGTAAGYRFAAQQTGNLFASQDQKPELIVGAGITSIKENGCETDTPFAPVWRLDVEITVDWQVFDPLEKKLVYRASTSGSVQVNRDRGADTIPIDGAREAFRDAAKKLFTDPKFLAAVKDPRGGPPSAGGALFPEASSATPTAAPATQIARLPLSTTEFRANVTNIREQVVTILTPQGNGSGFYISKDLLLTNQHVIDGYVDVRISFFGGRQIAGTVIASDARRDMALVRTEAQAFAGLPLRLENPEVASQVFVIGSPLDPKNEGTVSAGIVSAFRDTEYGPMLQSDVGVTFGNSGGPMFDDKGNVIALADLKQLDRSGNPTQVNLFIPIADGLKKLNIEFGPTAAAQQ